MNVYMHSDHMLFTTFASVLYRIYNLSWIAFGWSLYIRYNTPLMLSITHGHFLRLKLAFFDF